MRWDRCQVLRDFSHDARRHLRVECRPEVAQHFRRRNYDEVVECVGVSHAVEQVCDLRGKPLFRLQMPIGLLHRAARDAIGCQISSRLVGTLLPRRWILLFEFPLGAEIDMKRITFVSQKPRFRSVGNQHERARWNAYVCHDTSSA